MNNVLRYKGYSARPEFSVDDKVFYGKILGIGDLVDFYSADAAKLEEEFRAAVDDYLEFCAEVGKQPQKAFSGTFNVRIPAELHRKAAQKAQEERTSLNQIVESALEDYLEPDHQKTAVMVLPPEAAKQFMQPIQTVKTSGFGAASAGAWNFMNKDWRVKAC